MTILFFLGDWLLIFSLVMLVTVSYRTYILIPQLERPKRTSRGLAVPTFLTLALVGIALINIIHTYPNQYFSLLIYLVALMIWITSSWWRVSTDQNRQLFLLNNVLAAVGFLLLLGLLLVNLLQRFIYALCEWVTGKENCSTLQLVKANK